MLDDVRMERNEMMDKNQQAIERMKEQKYEEAAELFHSIIEENPDDPVGYIISAICSCT